jgi:hypothetical protein
VLDYGGAEAEGGVTALAYVIGYFPEPMERVSWEV